MPTILEQHIRELEASEAALRHVLATTADGIVIVDLDGKVRYMNPAAEQLLGRRADDMIGEEFGFPVVATDNTEIDVLRAGEVVVAELRVADTVWYGRDARIASLRDITQRRRSEEQAYRLVRAQAARAEAEAGERRARFLAEAASILAASLDYPRTLRSLADLAVPHLADWCIIDLFEADGGFRRLAVVQRDPARESVARRFAATCPAADAAEGVSEALRARQARHYRALGPAFFRSLLRDITEPRDIDSAAWREAVVAPLVSRGRPFGAITLLREPERDGFSDSDVALAEELAVRSAVAVDNARLFHEAQAANTAKSEFLAIMSHELRTPLNAIIGYADLLTLGVPERISDTATSHVDRIRTSASHLLTLIEEILTFSRIEAGREQVRTSTFDVDALISDVVDLARPAADEKGVSIHTAVDADLPEMTSDAGKLRQILLNLVSNAVKFTDDGVVCLRAQSIGDDIVIQVEDSGWGIDSSHFETIFQPFWQAERSRTRRAEGTGLGLTVALRLARMLGGDIAVDSRLNSGSTFTLRLPVTAPHTST